MAPEHAAAVVALWRGLLHDEQAAGAAEEIGRDWTASERKILHEDAGLIGLAAQVRGRTLAEVALEALGLAEAGLARLGATEDARLLAPLWRAAESGETPASALLRDWSARGPAAILERA